MRGLLTAWDRMLQTRVSRIRSWSHVSVRRSAHARKVLSASESLLSQLSGNQADALCFIYLQIAFCRHGVPSVPSDQVFGTVCAVITNGFSLTSCLCVFSFYSMTAKTFEAADFVTN